MKKLKFSKIAIITSRKYFADYVVRITPSKLVQINIFDFFGLDA